MSTEQGQSEQVPPLQIVKCGQCDGVGVSSAGDKCVACMGYGVYGVYANALLLTVGFSTRYPAGRQGGLYLVTVLYELLLKAFALIPVGIFGYVVWTSFADGVPLGELLFQRSWLGLLFWWSLLSWGIVLAWMGKYGSDALPIAKLLAIPSLGGVPPARTPPIEKLLRREMTVSFSPTLKRVLLACQRAYPNQQITPLHLLKVLSHLSLFERALLRLNVDVAAFSKILDQALAAQESVPLQKRSFSREVEEIFFYALWFSVQMRGELVRTHMVLLAMSRFPEVFSLFQQVGVSLENFQNTILWTDQLIKARRHKAAYWRVPYRRSSKADAGWTSGFTNLLNRYSTDLTMRARMGYLPPTIGRDSEIESMLHVLDRVTKSHVLLVGEVGVGTSSIVQGMARRIAEGSVSEQLKRYRVVSLNIAALFSENRAAGATQRVSASASADQLFSAVMHELARSGEVVLVLEDVHLLFSDAGNAMNVFSLMRPYLEGNVFKAVATTNPSTFAKTLERNEAFANFFHVQRIAEPTTEVALQMVKIIAIGIERAHNVILSYPAMEKAVDLAHRYIKGKALPSKAIDLLDEAAVVAKQRGVRQVNELVIVDLVTQQTGIPVDAAKDDEAEKLLSLESLLHRRVIGQEEAVKAVAAAMRRARSGLRSGNRPIATFLFMGPTGVGKTELSKALAEEYFGSEKNIIRLDMSEYQNAEDIYKLLGTPGSDMGGYLTEAVRNAPFSLVLLDELEKANSKIWDIFLQVFDDGRLTDSRGVTIDFANTIIIATSNVGSDYIQSAISAGWDDSQIKEQLLTELQKSFRPEFINRFDGTIVFKPLTKDDLYQIAQLIVAGIARQMQDREITFALSREFLEYLVDKGYNPQFGARPLRRVIQEEVENVLAEKMLRGELKKYDTITL